MAYGSIAELIANQPDFNRMKIRGGESPYREPVMPGEQRLVPSMQEKLQPGLPPVRKAQADSRDFLDDYLASRGNVEPTLIAADVLIPDLNEDGSPRSTNVIRDYPQLPDVGLPYRTLGVYGRGTYNPNAEGYQPGFTKRGLIRGVRMKFVPGGVPATPEFNYEASKQAFPEYMRDIKPGYMPVYYDESDHRVRNPNLTSPAPTKRPVTPAPSIPAPRDPEFDAVLDRILREPVKPRPSNPSNPFAGEDKEFQDMMRRLGVIK